MTKNFRSKKFFSIHNLATPTIFIFGIVMVLLIFSYVLFLMRGKFAFGTDFIHFYTAAQIVKEGKGSSLYKVDVQRSFQLKLIKKYLGEELTFSESKPVAMFMNPPFVVLFYLPFSLMEYDVGYISFLALNIFFLWMLIFLSSRYFKKINRLFLYISPPLFLPVIGTLFMGQPTLILAIVTLFIFLSLTRKKTFQAGIFTALFLIKPQFMIITPFLYILVQDKRRFVLGFLSMLAILVGISILISGITPTLSDYIHIIAAGQDYWKYDPQAVKMVSLNGLLAFIFRGWLYGYKSIGLNVVCYFVAILVFIRNPRNAKFGHRFLIAVFFTLLFSGHTLLHDLVILLPPLFALLDSKVMITRKIFLTLSLFFATSLSFWWGLVPTIIVMLVFSFSLVLGLVDKQVINANKSLEPSP
ncbi:hypothetical protein A2962_01375 [Candidatus Woesebacteria bacterium RIFCSPLOWO2_01_FULL_39_61]|uniref:DUF2029 domain-containing protein n=1 Tax=Candidatus Woesebacteria bacterium RIFCSPHIGHO2_02_FULL_39_13 TaxID=1802505 RepID=A0A1F7Z4Y3_9BACT|nr:MAG: hypothetical protein A2692_01615 [Candidatus Woesebacteria bacterium RIFCSPHIGHO2_01_FULL_39_95]OGM34500.1 MAG: hypothetical protein A3D01_03070 [Candidatus Woesebacteria bacterium RIFCSPHIGHO2_02_FULL_39_13]OGM38767.1 MAG: hypothetical protein A3E13_00960 [Candidatus Woesebacteria bacterium RIFCSPHIGHO2_12_FULL_40_20]OGM65773.1 MAG: hypothetical protein A2962_01375 [Candidatus Woesebacteria bacterium RIFCSPLOWO2_01_FULL_39_61]OGM72024.1 MAG: hypothetical protein A3H19_04225 [Candidatus